MKKKILWVKALRDYHDYSDEKLVPFGTSIKNQLAIDTDVPASGLPALLTVLIYLGYINDVNTDIIARQNSKSVTLTADEISKVSILHHNTDIIVNYIENTVNQKFAGDENKITAIYGRFGLKVAGHGKGMRHIFKVLAVDSGSATLQCPAAGEGACYHSRFSTDGKTWTQIKSSHKSTFTIINLPKDVRVYFQYDVSQAVGKGKYAVVSASATDYSWSDPISELIPA